MGQSESTTCVKRFVNKPQDAVHDALQGLLWTSPNLCMVGSDPDVKIIARSNWERDRVAVVVGGGAGHEPADIGLVGEGLLTAAVCGEIFSPPPPESMSRALLAVVGPKGCVVVIRNHFGTVLAVKAGIRNAQLHKDWPPEARVRVVAVADDVATSEQKEGEWSFKNARGVAGIVLVMKVAGAAAAAGLSVDEVYEETLAMANVVRTQGVCFTSCSIPGQQNMRPIPQDEMEVGCGIHGEMSRLRVKATTTAKEIVQIMVTQLMAFVDEDAPLCVLLNNLGAVPPNEMFILAAEVMSSVIGPRIKLFIGPATILTSLDSNGISLSIAPLDDRRIGRLCALADCRYWCAPIVPSPPQHLHAPEWCRRESSSEYESSANAEVSCMLKRVCEELIIVEQDLNMLDAHYKNGDCGRNLARAARLMLVAVEKWPLASPKEFCHCVASLLRSVEGALSALFSIFFFKAGSQMSHASMWSLHLVEHFEWALAEVEALGEFEEGMRTFADALGPGLRAVEKCGFVGMAEAALKGARDTAFMQKATGRAAHTSAEMRMGFPDTGAMAVAFVFAVMAAPPGGTFLKINSDAGLEERYTLQEIIGTGAYGFVRLATRCQNNSTVAIKSSARRKEVGMRSFEDLDFVEKQRMRNWLFRDKLHIVQVYEVLASPMSVHLVMELLAGPSLSDWLLDGHAVTEQEVGRCVKQMMLAVKDIHDFGMVHRDLKLDNFVFVDRRALDLKLVDVVGTMQFHVVLEGQKKTLCGTGHYLSPEALTGHSSPAADVWALGVSMYLIVNREYPFRSASLRELHEAQQTPLGFDSAPWLCMSQDARDLARGLLAMNPDQRLTVCEALESRWFAHCDALPAGGSLLPVLNEMPANPRGLNTMGAGLTRLDSPIAKTGECVAIVKTLFLVRHGEAVHNILEREAKKRASVAAKQQGLSPAFCKEEAERVRKQVLQDEALHDAALSLDGKVMALNAQAQINQLLSKGFAKPTCILVSPLERTLQTAALIFPGHPNTHVVEALRERRTGLPCDERKSAQEVAMRATFQHMSFENLCIEDVEVFLSDLCSGVEDAQELRSRTRAFLGTMPNYEDDVIAIVTHKGFLRELERGPLGRSDATEFGNCEVRVYDVVFPVDGGESIAACGSAHLLHLEL
eukprot:CAMPEP_0203954616 /NCGR_PEP_ID=MMETSP0359-20131031/87555_1 /ASSEMBLY_ACC=CAM_ASM_000338 /TAXON_ID=268821 /ORGANISM="Scrippsiella Hangoei, Strain SHTV-5" /LENGTH=1145 /DNA_ID=CAMNT_0050888149 /DNA_START=48 /DNA_END=3483 /DNA_ORIENTATION=+